MKTYIQIGSNIGNDYFYHNLIKPLKEKSKVILIEPNPNVIQTLNENYQTIKDFHDVNILCKGVVHDKSINTLYNTDATELGNVIKRKSFSGSGVLNFEPILFAELCSLFSITEIEILYIDTEGYDYTLLDNIDFFKYKIKNVYCEKWPYENDSSICKTGQSYFNESILPKMNKIYDSFDEMHDGMNMHLFKSK
jgi:FkbM family methyltransferase